MRRFAVVLVLCNFASCACEMVASDFDQTCAADEDCAAVYAGPVCTMCGGCANAAINVKDFENYENTPRVACVSPGGYTCGACAPLTPYCNDGKCDLQ